MKTEKPLRLVELLGQLLAETDKMNVGKIYIAIAEENKSITYSESNAFSGLVYKHLVNLAIKDFIHSGRSEASGNVLKDIMGILSNADIVVG